MARLPQLPHQEDVMDTERLIQRGNDLARYLERALNSGLSLTDRDEARAALTNWMMATRPAPPGPPEPPRPVRPREVA